MINIIYFLHYPFYTFCTICYGLGWISPHFDDTTEFTVMWASTRGFKHSYSRSKVNIFLTFEKFCNIEESIGVRNAIVEAVDDIDEELFESRLYTKDIPDPEIILRTSGERRLSNYLLWQSAGAEYHFTETLWPAFSRADLEKIIQDYRGA